jgi:hypothetical protein
MDEISGENANHREEAPGWIVDGDDVADNCEYFTVCRKIGPPKLTY